MVTVGSAIGATIPTTFGQTKCNVLIDTGAMKSCMNQAYYQQLMLPAVMILHYNTTLTPSSKAIYSGTKYYDTHIEFHSLFLDVSSTDV